MGSLVDQFSNAGPSGNQHQFKRNRDFPEGFQPSAVIDTEKGGYIVSKPYTADSIASHAEILEEWGYDAEEWVVKSSTSAKTLKADGSTVTSQRINVVPRSTVPEYTTAATDMEEILENLVKWRPESDRDLGSHRFGSFFAPVGDQQVGKIDGGGTEGIISRSLTEYQRGFDRFQALKSRRNLSFSEIVLPQLGDCIEGFNSQGGANILRTDLGLTSMVRVYRRLLHKQIETYLGQADKIVIPIAPGNHDEALRVANKMGSSYTDSWAIDAASALMDAFSMNPALDGKIEFRFPEEDELTVAFETSGTVVGIAHGHQFGPKPLDWWNKQAGLRSPIGDADLLLAGHLHHLQILDHSGGRTFVQVPALDGGSQWIKHTSGVGSPSRTVTFWVADGGIYDFDPIGK